MPVVRPGQADPAIVAMAVRAARARRVDVGLRAHLGAVYLIMCVGIAITATTAWVVAQLAIATEPAQVRHILPDGRALNALGEVIYLSPLRWAVLLLPLPVAFGLAAAIDDITPMAARVVFCVYSALIGVSVSVVFLLYAPAALIQVFLATIVAFASLSLWGYTTRRGLSGLGGFLMMGAVGVIAALAFNLFHYSSAVALAASVIGVIVFAGLTAWDTQRIKINYLGCAEHGTQQDLRRSAVTDALALYLDFVNMLLLLLFAAGRQG